MLNYLLIFDRLRRSRRINVPRRELEASLLTTALYLLAIVMLHVLAMRVFEGMGIGEALWLTATTITTVGYGDVTPATTGGRLASVGLLYLGGIFVLAKLAADYFDYRSKMARLKRRGEWDWHMTDHILILNAPEHQREAYLSRLAAQFRTSKIFEDSAIQLLSTAFPEGLPEEITRRGGIVHLSGRSEDPRMLRSAGADKARAIVILARPDDDPLADSVTFDLLHRISEFDCQGTVVAECVVDENRPRLRAAGADIVIRPIRAYPGMIVRALETPGAEQVIEHAFRPDKDHFTRFDVTISGIPWMEIVQKLAYHGIGTAVGYVSSMDRSVTSFPALDQEISAEALIIVEHGGRSANPAEIEELLTAAKSKTNQSA